MSFCQFAETKYCVYLTKAKSEELEAYKEDSMFSDRYSTDPRKNYSTMTKAECHFLPALRPIFCDLILTILVAL